MAESRPKVWVSQPLFDDIEIASQRVVRQGAVTPQRGERVAQLLRRVARPRAGRDEARVEFARIAGAGQQVGLRGGRHGGPGMAALIAERFDKEIGGAVDDLGLIGEVGCRIDEAGQLHHPRDAVERPCRRPRLRRRRRAVWVSPDRGATA